MHLDFSIFEMPRQAQSLLPSAHWIEMSLRRARKEVIPLYSLLHCLQHTS